MQIAECTLFKSVLSIIVQQLYTHSVWTSSGCTFTFPVEISNDGSSQLRHFFKTKNTLYYTTQTALPLVLLDFYLNFFLRFSDPANFIAQRARVHAGNAVRMATVIVIPVHIFLKLLWHLIFHIKVFELVILIHFILLNILLTTWATLVQKKLEIIFGAFPFSWHALNHWLSIYLHLFIRWKPGRHYS